MTNDVLVWGGGTGGVAAALQSARSGASTLLLTPGPWLGGMLSAAGVSAPSVGDPYDFSNLEWDVEDERYVTVEPEREIVPEEQPEAAPVHADDSK